MIYGVSEANAIPLNFPSDLFRERLKQKERVFLELVVNYPEGKKKTYTAHGWPTVILGSDVYFNSTIPTDSVSKLIF